MTRLASDRGFTLIELLVAMTLSLLILGATLTAFEAVQDNHQRTVEHNDAQDQVRRATDRLARDLRNLADAEDLGGGVTSDAVEKNGRWDLIFKSVDDGISGAPPVGNPRGLKRVRLCLDARTRSDGRLILQQQSAAAYTSTPPATSLAAGAPCTMADAGWTTRTVVASSVVNRLDPDDERELFTYAADGRQLAYDGGAVVLQDISRLATTVVVDPTPTRSPRASTLTTSVFLRNQNRNPVASFSCTWVNRSGRVVLLNGTASQDPEGETLQRFEFWDLTTNTRIATSAEFQWTMPDSGNHTVQLRVWDLAGRTGASPTQTITATQVAPCT